MDYAVRLRIELQQELLAVASNREKAIAFHHHPDLFLPALDLRPHAVGPGSDSVHHLWGKAWKRIDPIPLPRDAMV